MKQAPPDLHLFKLPAGLYPQAAPEKAILAAKVPAFSAAGCHPVNIFDIQPGEFHVPIEVKKSLPRPEFVVGMPVASRMLVREIIQITMPAATRAVHVKGLIGLKR